VENQDSELDIETLAGDRGERGRSGAGIAWLALLLALAVAAFAGWQWWQERASVDAAAEQAAAVSQLRGELLKLSRRLDDLQSTQDGLQAAGTELARIDAEIAGMAARLDRADTEYGREREKTRDLESEYASLADRVGAMESSIAALAVRGESPGKRIELAEIDFLLRSKTGVAPHAHWNSPMPSSKCSTIPCTCRYARPSPLHAWTWMRCRWWTGLD
jgi:septal ring factor EnvC (AmiA/AmiB activator)